MSGHTPGPWIVFVSDSGDQWTGWPLSITAPGVHEDCMVVRTGGQWPYDWDYRISQGEAVANAKLIAAAPDLLEALKLCVGALGNDAPVHDSYWDAVRRGEAAITKAEGK